MSHFIYLTIAVLAHKSGEGILDPPICIVLEGALYIKPVLCGSGCLQFKSSNCKTKTTQFKYQQETPTQKTKTRKPKLQSKITKTQTTKPKILN